MKTLIFGIIVALSVLFFLVGALIYLNRDATALWQKIIPAVALGIVGAFFSLWISLKDNKIDVSFQTTFINHKTNGSPLEKIEPRFSIFYGGKVFQERGFLKPLDKQNMSDFHLDLAFIEIAVLLYETFQEFKNRPGSDLYSSNKYPTSLNLPRKVICWSNFIKKFECTPDLKNQIRNINNEAYEMKNMTIPLKTSIQINYDKNSSRSIIFKNKFSEISIQVFSSHGSIGIGEWKWLFDYDDDKNNQYWSSTINVILSAKFEKLLSGNPEMSKYIKWAGALFDNIETNLDSKKILDLAREKHHLYKLKIDNYFNKEVFKKNKNGKSVLTPVRVQGQINTKK